VLADSAYGDATEFRRALDGEGWPYCVGISSTLKVVAADHDFGQVPPYRGQGRPPTRPGKVRPGAKAPSVKEWAQERAKEFRRVTWREGTKGKLSSRFAAWRVRPAHRLSAGQEPLAECWLVAEWPEGEAEPTKYFFSNLAAGTSLLRLVRTAKGRWWVETVQADYPSSRRWVCTLRIGYHRHSGVARVSRVVPATPGRTYRRSRMFDTTRHPAPPRA
jgi:SRSO17 transposase